jgi:hypothetical protein
MGYIVEPKDVDMVVGPSVFTDATGKTIAKAIALYKKTGQKPVSVNIDKQDALAVVTTNGHTPFETVQAERL